MTLDQNTLIEMLTYGRPYQSAEEDEWIERFIDPLKPDVDEIKNRIFTIAGNDKIIFSAHTDTVHAFGGRQSVHRYKGTPLLCKADNTPLGADDGAGVFLLLRMIQAKVPGTYIFHRGEEVGAYGSNHILDKEPTVLEGKEIAIAFDRRGTTDIITHQGTRTASDAFANSLAAALNLGHSPARGVFTDTKVYSKKIPECSNVSVGYYNEHTNREVLDMHYLNDLSDRVTAIDWSKLKVERDPSVVEPYYWGDYSRQNGFEFDGYGYGYGAKDAINRRYATYGSSQIERGKSVIDIKPEVKKHYSTQMSFQEKREKLLELVESFPDEIAEFLLTKTYFSFDAIDEYVLKAAMKNGNIAIGGAKK